MLASIVYFYLVTGRVWGATWVVALCLLAVVKIVTCYHFAPIPVFDIGPEKAFNIALSGHLAPQIFSAAAMAYIIRLRSDTLRESQRAYGEAKVTSLTSQQLSEQLVNVLQQALQGSDTLLGSANDLSNLSIQTLETMSESVVMTSEAVNAITTNNSAASQMATGSTQPCLK